MSPSSNPRGHVPKYRDTYYPPLPLDPAWGNSSASDADSQCVNLQNAYLWEADILATLPQQPRNWKAQLSTNKWRNKEMCYILSMGFFSTINKNKTMIFAGRKDGCIMWSKTSQNQREKHYVFSHLQNLHLNLCACVCTTWKQKENYKQAGMALKGAVNNI